MSKKNFFLVVILVNILFLNSVIMYSQPLTWYRTWGLSGISRYESGQRVVQTFDGGYAVLTEIGNTTITWFDLLKYDYLGNLQWVNVIIDSTNRMLKDMQQTSDSGFIIAGWSSGALLVRTDKNGILKWQKNYTNLNSGTSFWAVKQTRDNGFIACGDYTDYGNPSSKGIVIKVDSLGFIQWEKQYMDSLFNGYADIIQGHDGKYYLTGGTNKINPNVYYALIKKLDLLGNVIWTNIFYANGGGGDITQLSDGSLIVGGISTNTGSQPILAKFDTLGNTKWVYYYSTPNLRYNYMTKDLFENIIITGGYENGGYNYTIGIWKLDTSGMIIKTKNLVYSIYSLIGPHCMKITNDTGYIITGVADLNSNSDLLVVKTDSAFNVPIITRISCINSSITDEFKLYQNYPNPFNTSTNFKFFLPNNGYININIYNILGKNVFSSKEFRNNGFNEKYIDFDNLILSSGVYFIQVNFDSKSKLIKAIYLK